MCMRLLNLLKVVQMLARLFSLRISLKPSEILIISDNR